MEVRNVVEEIVCNVLGKMVTIDDAANLMYDYNMDSIQIMNVVVMLEQQFDVEFELEDLIVENLLFFSKLVELVEKLVEEKG